MQPNAGWSFGLVTSGVWGGTIGRKTGITWCEVANGQCWASRHPDQPSGSSPSIAPFTTPPTSSAISFPAIGCASSGPGPRSNGKLRLPPPEWDCPSALLQLRSGSCDPPYAGLESDQVRELKQVVEEKARLRRLIAAQL